MLNGANSALKSQQIRFPQDATSGNERERDFSPHTLVPDGGHFRTFFEARTITEAWNLWLRFELFIYLAPSTHCNISAAASRTSAFASFNSFDIKARVLLSSLQPNALTAYILTFPES